MVKMKLHLSFKKKKKKDLVISIKDVQKAGLSLLVFPLQTAETTKDYIQKAARK